MEGPNNRIIRQSRKVRLEKILQVPTVATTEPSSIFDCLFLLAVHVPESVIVTNRKGEILWVNIGFANLCGYTLREVVGKRPGLILQGKRTDFQTVEKLRHAVREGLPCDCEIINYRKDRSAYAVSLVMRPIFDSSQIVGFVAVATELPE